MCEYWQCKGVFVCICVPTPVCTLCRHASVCECHLVKKRMSTACLARGRLQERERVVEGGVGGCGESAQRLLSGGWCDTEASRAQTRPKHISLPSSCLPQVNLVGGNEKVITSLHRVM